MGRALALEPEKLGLEPSYVTSAGPHCELGFAAITWGVGAHLVAIRGVVGKILALPGSCGSKSPL